MTLPQVKWEEKETIETPAGVYLVAQVNRCIQPSRLTPDLLSILIII
jgi:hypothetical protein